MKKVNVVFDDVLDDVDIIAVPDEIECFIETIGQEFLYWVPTAPDEDEEYWIFIDGRKYNNAETTGFIKWLNRTYCLETEKAYIVESKTNYCPEYKVVEF